MVIMYMKYLIFLLVLMVYLVLRRSLREQAFQTSVHMSHKRRDAHDGTHGEDHDGEEDRIGEGDRRQVRRTVMAHHDGIEERHHCRSELGQHHRKRHLQVALVIGPVCGKRMHVLLVIGDR